SNATLVLPLTGGARWIVVNNTTGSYTLTVQGSSGSGVSITSGAPISVFTDGTNYYGVSANLSGAYLPIGGTAVAATKLATARTISMTGDVSWTSPVFDGTANVTAAGTIAAGAVNLAKMANFQANSLMGNPTGSAATPSAITLQNGLIFSGTNLGLGSITPSSVAATGNSSFAAYLAVNQAIAAASPLDVQTGSGRVFIGALSSVNSIISVNSANSSYTPLTIQASAYNFTGAGTAAFSGPVTTTTLTSSNTVVANTNFLSSNNFWLGATSTAGTMLLRPNGVGSTSGQLELDSTGNVTINGSLVVTGTINFGTSDATLKELGAPVEPQPFHRVPYYAYARRDTGELGWGPTAQDVATIAPAYTRLQRLSVNGNDRDVLLLAKEQITMDTAFWAGRQVDLLWGEVANLRRQLIDAGAH